MLNFLGLNLNEIFPPHLRHALYRPFPVGHKSNDPRHPKISITSVKTRLVNEVS